MPRAIGIGIGKPFGARKVSFPSYLRLSPAGNPPLMYADFDNNNYWYDGAEYATKADWQAAVGSTVGGLGPDYADWDTAAGSSAAPFNYQGGTFVTEYATNDVSVGVWSHSSATFTNRLEHFTEVGANVRLFHGSTLANVGSQASGFYGTCYSMTGPSSHAMALHGKASSLAGTYSATAKTRAQLGFRKLTGQTVNIPMNGTTQRIISWAYYDEAFTQTQVNYYSCMRQSPPIILLGDSFVVADTIRSTMQSLQSTPRSVFANGASGENMTQHAARLTADLEYLPDATVVIMDGGLTSDTQSEVLAALASIDAQVTSGKWLYFEPNYDTSTQIIGTARRTEMDAIMNAVEAAYPDNFVRTLSYMQTQTGADAGEIALGIIDTADMVDSIHYNTATYAIAGTNIQNTVDAKGW